MRALILMLTLTASPSLANPLCDDLKHVGKVVIDTVAPIGQTLGEQGLKANAARLLGDYDDETKEFLQSIIDQNTESMKQIRDMFKEIAPFLNC
jgi:hypothetical protein